MGLCDTRWDFKVQTRRLIASRESNTDDQVMRCASPVHLDGVNTVGVTSGAEAEEFNAATETLTFSLPKELRRPAQRERV
jgi:hypothetical protein